MLLNNNLGGPIKAGRAVIEIFGDAEIRGLRTALDELAANFTDPHSQGPRAYADQFLNDYPDYDRSQAKAEAVAAVGEFCDMLAEAMAK